MAPPIQFGLGLSLARAGGAALDADAAAYIAAVEFEDGQALESGVRKAINNFVVGCKVDGIWDAIKASCILAGARTLDGALVPLVGTAPTNNNFVSGDYDRETGLVGNGSTKYLNSNRNNNSDPQNSKHASVYYTQGHSRDVTRGALGSATAYGGTQLITTTVAIAFRANTVNVSSDVVLTDASSLSGLFAVSRTSSSNLQSRYNQTTANHASTSTTRSNETIDIFRRVSDYSNGRASFYSIGEALDLAALDTRVSTLMTDLAAAIP